MSLQVELYHRFLNLPKDVLILIYLYNADHRPQMENVNKIYHSLVYQPCFICEKPLTRLDGCYVIDYFVNLHSKNKLKNHCTKCYNKHSINYTTLVLSGLMRADFDNVKILGLYIKEKSILYNREIYHI
jgi:hypothetical protein